MVRDQKSGPGRIRRALCARREVPAMFRARLEQLVRCLFPVRRTLGMVGELDATPSRDKAPVEDGIGDQARGLSWVLYLSAWSYA